jgi:hypothetical protein
VLASRGTIVSQYHLQLRLRLRCTTNLLTIDYSDITRTIVPTRNTLFIIFFLLICLNKPRPVVLAIQPFTTMVSSSLADPLFLKPNPTADTDEDWFHWDEAERLEAESSSSSSPPGAKNNALNPFPPQLHPAVSLGVQRVSSCYFSIASDKERESVADFLSLWDESSLTSLNEGKCLQEDDAATRTTSSSLPVLPWKPSDVLYHDILMHVFTFLNAQSLAAFSQTARRTNFEVFYFLQLQLQRALLVNSCHADNLLLKQETNVEDNDYLSSIDGTSYLSRLALLNPQEGQETVAEYLRSNSTLKIMPLSHSLAYIRHVLQRHGFHTHMADGTPSSSSRALASGALFMTVVGAAFMSGTADHIIHIDSFGTELPNMLFRVGFVGSLMGAAKQMSDTEQRKAMRETAEQMAHSMQQFPEQLSRSMQQLRNPHNDHDHDHDIADNQNHPFHPFARMMQAVNRMIPHSDHNVHNNDDDDDRRGSALKEPITPNPYEHLPPTASGTDARLLGEEKKKQDDSQLFGLDQVPVKKMVSGCVGAYSRAIQRAATQVTQIMKEQRKAKYDELWHGEQLERATAFLEACTSDESILIVKELAEMVDVDGFYIGSDGTETCALHTAALHGSAEVLDFLCQGIDASDASRDGGLCDVNLKDANGWTALHFASGANSVAAVKVLVKHGAELSVEATNGYTALSWAQRLSNHEVAEELRELVGDQHQLGWMSSQPLAIIANRFFSLIPTH